MIYKNLASFLMTTTLLTGCTHLEVSKLENNVAPQAGGYAYSLDFTQYEIVLTRTLSDCTKGKMPVVIADAKVTSQLVADGDQLYVIDPGSMISAFKTSDVSIEYKNGRLTGFNASTVDKTGDVLASVLTTVGKIAMMAAVPIPMAAGAQFCTEGAARKLQLINDSKQLIENATSNLEEGQGRLTTLTAQYAAKPTEKLRTEIKALSGNIKIAKDKLDAQTKAVSEAQAWLTNTVTIRWPETSADFHQGPSNPLPSATVAKWFEIPTIRAALASQAEFSAKIDDNDKLVVGGNDGSAERLGVSVEAFEARYPSLREGIDLDKCTLPGNPICAKAKTDLEAAIVERQIDRIARALISMHIVPRGSYGNERQTTSNSDRKAGLRYRVPADGRFYICKFADPCQTGAGTPLSQTDGAVAQLGTVFHIPFSSPAFASGSISVKFDDQGRLLSAGLKRDNAAALGVANTAATAADQVSAVLAAAEKAEITELNNATKLAQAIKARDDAQAGLTKSPQQLAADKVALLKLEQEIAGFVKTPQQLAADKLALLKTDQEIAGFGPDRARELTKEIQIAKLEGDLAEARRKQLSDPNAGDAAIAAQYETQTLVFNSQRASAEAELRLIQAQRALTAGRTQP